MTQEKTTRRRKGRGETIDAIKLSALLRKGKNNIEIGAHFNVTPKYVSELRGRYGLTKEKIEQIRVKDAAHAKNCQDKRRLFFAINEEHTNQQVVKAILQKAIQDNNQIWEFMKSVMEKLHNTDKSKALISFRPVLKSFLELQQAQVDRIKDKTKIDADTFGIDTIQEYLRAFSEAIMTLPIEEQQKFNNELKKRNLAYLEPAQLVSPDANNDTNGDIQEATTVTNEIPDVDSGQKDGPILEGEKLLERPESNSN